MNEPLSEVDAKLRVEPARNGSSVRVGRLFGSGSNVVVRPGCGGLKEPASRHTRVTPGLLRVVDAHESPLTCGFVGLQGLEP